MIFRGQHLYDRYCKIACYSTECWPFCIVSDVTLHSYNVILRFIRYILRVGITTKFAVILRFKGKLIGSTCQQYELASQQHKLVYQYMLAEHVNRTNQQHKLAAKVSSRIQQQTLAEDISSRSWKQKLAAAVISRSQQQQLAAVASCSSQQQQLAAEASSSSQQQSSQQQQLAAEASSSSSHHKSATEVSSTSNVTPLSCECPSHIICEASQLSGSRLLG